MSLSNSFQSYGGVAKTFHWLTALLILTALPLGLIADNLAEAVIDPAIASTDADVARAALLFSLHKAVGVTVFFVALLRILWALTQPKPGLLNADHKLEALAAETVHWLLYGSLVFVPLTGWIHHAATTGFAPIWWPFGQNLPFVPKDAHVAELFAGLHYVLQWVLIGALVLHIAGAVKHHVIDRDMTLRRMLPGSSDLPQPPAQKHSLLPLLCALILWGGALLGGSMIGVYSHATDQAEVAELEAVQSDWQVTEGTLAITVQQFGSPVSGAFADWTAAITFDEPSAPGPAGSVDVTISIGSLTLGSVTDQAMGADFFNVEAFPTATFKGEIIKTETGYEATGPLTIRDQSVPITLPFALDLQDTTATMTGALQLNRLDFAVGAHMPDEGSLGFGVSVDINLTATRGQ
ncbi:cytochrome b/b6 domain-containing protein [Tropicibacter sp. R16_0]|uniref:cytochrome b/b6 domain-containing protein n=1 Tax=Tropicibacter sp. R16_0 TaxID=2821102 RepID=UPI001ADACCBB|nr:cytochrome b/b6 domain-containing protein [Tropicibacter sp. R16_0]MBO9453103.1 cytochrome b/b6 domain-containing protein [Tropicibacter sp. R16_0]